LRLFVIEQREVLLLETRYRLTGFIGDDNIQVHPAIRSRGLLRKCEQ
jgi:hypothetical protein